MAIMAMGNTKTHAHKHTKQDIIDYRHVPPETEQSKILLIIGMYHPKEELQYK